MSLAKEIRRRRKGGRFFNMWTVVVSYFYGLELRCGPMAGLSFVEILEEINKRGSSDKRTTPKVGEKEVG